jgi:hypothetical protein
MASGGTTLAARPFDLKLEAGRLFKPDRTAFTRLGLRCAIADGDFTELERVDALDTRNIETKQTRITSALVVCINPADATEVVLRCHRVPLV